MRQLKKKKKRQQKTTTAKKKKKKKLIGDSSTERLEGLVRAMGQGRDAFPVLQGVTVQK